MVEAHGYALAGEVVADRVLSTGEADQAGGVDETVDFDRVSGLAGRDGGAADKYSNLSAQYRLNTTDVGA